MSDFLQISNAKSFELDSSIIPAQKDLYPLLFFELDTKYKDNIIYKTRNFLQYEFKLILRGSRDGFDGESFHNKCIGGYNPLGWDSNDLKIR
ncbi:uncharacterized protein OCT59_004974 [Rhizophagus irregularis]|uniref:TLDc domain-containing protein n=1 Tax=Rhizophagus irregularis TaxID=588596 RepID=A0A915YQE1_9GLOM|nr:hypothetical protein OCT59_004974 [Rhizophagus irregularis]GBC21560.2 hypothetical protein GLOIN_2v1789120 [Rhizophagus irregularis DAOM 181602=DAOM 197198]CAB5312931.1 unnamed protein product [Rhizophagus irregularis]